MFMRRTQGLCLERPIARIGVKHAKSHLNDPFDFWENHFDAAFARGAKVSPM